MIYYKQMISQIVSPFELKLLRFEILARHPYLWETEYRLAANAV